MAIDMQTLREELGEFNNIDASLTEGDPIWKTVSNLCAEFELDESSFTEEWTAYAMSHDLEFCEQSLAKFKIKQDQVRSSRNALSNKTNMDNTSLRQPIVTKRGANLLAMYGDDDAQMENMAEEEVEEELDDGAMDTHDEPSKRPPMRATTEDVHQIMFIEAYTSLAEKYRARTTAEKLLTSFTGDRFESSKTAGKSTADVAEVALDGQFAAMCDNEKAYRIMKCKASDVASYASDSIEAYASRVIDTLAAAVDGIKMEEGEEDDEGRSPTRIDPVYESSVEPIRICGRVTSDHDGKLQPTGVLIEGSWRDGEGKYVRLNLEKCNDYAMCAGMSICVEGTNPSGKEFIATSVIRPTAIPMASLPPLEGENDDNGELSMMTACGPFTTSDTLTYEPMVDLMLRVKKVNPHVLLLLGPLLPEAHPMIAKCTFEQTFENAYERLLVNIASMLDGTRTRVVIAASQKDASSCGVYPTCAQRISSTVMEQIKHRVTLVSDPCSFSVFGVRIAVSPTDLTMHLSANEIAKSSSKSSPDRISRLLCHLFDQSTYYAVHPPHPTINLDYSHMANAGRMAERPHLLVTCSDLMCFAKVVDEVVCVNAGHLCRGTNGGSYAMVNVDVMGARGEKEGKGVARYTHVDIRHI